MVALIAATATLTTGLAPAALADDEAAPATTATPPADTTPSATASPSTPKTDAAPSPAPKADTTPHGRAIPRAASNGAPDVTVKDMLDTDAATISKLTMTGRVTGTAPFDKDDNRGDDSGAGNAIVRSFDTVVYNYDYTVTPDDTMTYYKRARVGFRFELPYPADRVSFALDQMGWADRTKGFEPKTTTETINGAPTQVLTVYRLLEPTSSSPTVVPGSSSISLAVNVKAAPHGWRFHPKVTAWAAPNDVKHRTTSHTPGDVTVSARLSLNARIENLKRRTEGAFDFGAGASGDPNHDAGKVKGLMYGATLNVDLRWTDKAKGMKGLEIPAGPIGLDVDVATLMADEGSQAWHAPDAAWQALLWNHAQPGGNADDLKNMAIAAPDRTIYTWDAPGVMRTDKAHAHVWRISQTRATDRTTLHVVIPAGSWIADPDAWATRTTQTVGQCAAEYMAGDCRTRQVGPLASQYVNLVIPTVNTAGQSAAQAYGHDQTIRVTATDRNLTGSTATGDRLASAATDASNQAVTSDDRTQATESIRLDGSYIQRVWYGCPTKGWSDQSGLDCSGWTDQFSDSTDSAQPGAPILLTGAGSTTAPIRQLPVGQLFLTKFDPTVVEPTGDDTATLKGYWWSLSGAGRSSLTDRVSRKWAVKKDGKAWTGDDEQRATTIDRLDYYDTLQDARAHGTVVGVLMINRSAAEAVNNSQRLDFFTRTPARIRQDAKVGAVGQITMESIDFTREDMAAASGLDPETATDGQWAAWASGQDWLARLKAGDKHTWAYDGRNYVKAAYGPNGMIGGGTGGSNKGDSVLVVGEQPVIAATTAQQGGDGHAKTIYDLDKEQRSVDWDLPVSASTRASSTGGTYVTDLDVTATIPAGLTYLAGSATLDGTYTEHTPAQGAIDGGAPAEPTVTRNPDGSTLLTWSIPNVKADGTTHHLRLSTSIGDPSDPDRDARNNQRYTLTTTVMSRRNRAKPRESMSTRASFTVRVSRTHASMLATRALPLLADVETRLGFANMIGNFGTTDKALPYAVDVMPWMGAGSTSSFKGSYTLGNLTAKASGGANLTTAAFWFTTDTKYRTMDPVTISRTTVTSWHRASFDPATGTVAIPAGFDRPVAWAMTLDTLPKGGRIDVTVPISPKGNMAGSLYVNRWTDGDNVVDAVTQVVDRSVNGTAWWDYDGDGVRDDTDPVLKGVTVTLKDASGRIVEGLDGDTLVTGTDANGHWELDGIPAGSGYIVEFTPRAGTSWTGFRVTARGATAATEATDSDSTGVDDGRGLARATIALKAFPTAAAMTSARYVDPYEDHGMTGVLPTRAAPTLTVAKTIAGRADNQWLDTDSYRIAVTPTGSAPAKGLPAGVTIDSPGDHTLNVDPTAFTRPGDYTYTLREAKGTAPSVAYDTTSYTATVRVADDMDALTRTVTATLARGTTPAAKAAFANTYTATATRVGLKATKVFEGAAASKTDITSFEFGVYPKGVKDAKPVVAAHPARDGSITFPDIVYDQASMDNHASVAREYEVRETQGKAGGVTYSDKTAYVTVTVRDDGAGHLSATTVTPAGQTMTFTNRYQADPVKVTFKAVKDYVNKGGSKHDLKDGQFAFDLKDSTGRTIDTAANRADGTVAFKPIEVAKVGVSKYTISERDGGDGRIDYDAKTHAVTVTVTDDGLGQLQAEVTYDGKADAPVFTNTFSMFVALPFTGGADMRLLLAVVLPMLPLLLAVAWLAVRRRSGGRRGRHA
ncbi:Spy0128 family protein [Bifidobacterium margollesii]|nr:FctA domain-containing protein [Bifidobacterium margollesii]